MSALASASLLTGVLVKYCCCSSGERVSVGAHMQPFDRQPCCSKMPAHAAAKCCECLHGNGSVVLLVL
jgi:hypothetical protein